MFVVVVCLLLSSSLNSVLCTDSSTIGSTRAGKWISSVTGELTVTSVNLV